MGVRRYEKLTKDLINGSGSLLKTAGKALVRDARNSCPQDCFRWPLKGGIDAEADPFRFQKIRVSLPANAQRAALIRRGDFGGERFAGN